MTLRVLLGTEDKKYLLAFQKDDREYYNEESWSRTLPSTFYPCSSPQPARYVDKWWTDDFFGYGNADLIASFNTVQDYENWIKQHPELQI